MPQFNEWHPAGQAATPAFSDWRGEYFAHPDLAGTPALVRNDPQVSFNWVDSAPASGLPADDFSARWLRTLPLTSGLYRFYAHADDGVRAWLDNELIVDQWHESLPVTYTVERSLNPGNHTLRVDYKEHLGTAQLQFWWERVEDWPQWHTEYFTNPTLAGTPALIRADSTLDFNWSTGAPDPILPADQFSARWTHAFGFEAGRYRFHTWADDGIRLWVDGRLLINEWHDSERRESIGEVNLTFGLHLIRVDYYEHGGEASARVYWELIPNTYPDWKGEYWANREFAGSPAYTRNDSAIDFS